MFRKNYIVKINLPGGIVATGDLYAIVAAAEKAKVTDMQFGARQQLFCKVADRYAADFLKDLEAAGVFFETGKESYPNIVSSYVTEGVFSKSPWVSEGLYKDILDGFDYRPMLKINLVESSQSFVPFLTGHLNFISSTLNNHWHLVVRRPGTNEQYSWKTAVYSPDIPLISRLVEEEMSASLPPRNGGTGGGAGSGAAGAASVQIDDDWGERLYGCVQTRGLFPAAPVSPSLRLPAFRLPYYEGFNRYGNKHWLGIYRREELFPLSFLKDLSLLCGKTRIGQLYTTPWKSLLIKGIEDQELSLWEYVLGKYRMNVRHASNELNWQMEDFSPEGLRLKRYLVRQLDQDDIRTEGLSFSIKIRRGSGLSGSIIIRKQEEIRPGQLKLLDRYEIWHTPDFDPNCKEFSLFRKDLEKEMLFPYIVSLCKEFYQLQSRLSQINLEDGAGYHGQVGIMGEAGTFECRHCLTQYIATYGDPASGVLAGTAFEQLSPEYACPVCGAGLGDFRPVKKSTRVEEPLS